jgi:hypothetical protein
MPPGFVRTLATALSEAAREVPIATDRQAAQAP